MKGTKRVQRWLEISHRVRSCHAQWEDVGPFYIDSAGYVSVISDRLPVGFFDASQRYLMEASEVYGPRWLRVLEGLKRESPCCGWVGSVAHLVHFNFDVGQQNGSIRS
jgi:hypothetical protein